MRTGESEGALEGPRSSAGAAARAAERRLGDFEINRSVMLLAALAVPLGAACAAVALALLDLIGLITHLAYTGTFSTGIGQPNIHPLGLLSALVPVIGGLVVGLMARLGSERIRGHGIPEAMETILLRGSRMEPRLAVLKPLSSAISIGSGGPFGAEGPIIVTGGAVGSIAGQLLHLTAVERRSLLVAGAASGMTAVFGTPVAAVLLAAELLLFEWRPRSLIPVGVAACAAQVAREALVHGGLLRATPLFAMAPSHLHMHLLGAIPGAVAIGLGSGALAWLMTRCVYGAEDLFGRLRLHWSWWPALGGLVVGIGGLIDPRVLGVGYGTIDAELAGRLALGTLAVLLVLKLTVWSVALGSNTSGGILAPLLMIGAALGGLLGSVLPGAGEGTWALLGMAGALAGVTRSPFTSIVFAVELTGNVESLFPLLIVCVLAHTFSTLTLRRSILTEKVARRGYHVSRDYEVDPLQALLVRDVMSSELLTLAPLTPVSRLYDACPEGSEARRQRLYPVVDSEGGGLSGVVAWSDVLAARRSGSDLPVNALARHKPVVAHAEETLRAVADRMVATRCGALPVVERDGSGTLVGMVSQFDLLRARERVLIEERHRERHLGPGLLEIDLPPLLSRRDPVR